MTQMGINYERFISEGKDLAKKMFNLDIEFGKDCQNETEAGHYDFTTDIGYLHYKFCEMFNANYVNVDLKKLIEHTICHEIGHASDARCFAQSRVFPYIVKISDRSTVNILSRKLRTNGLTDSIVYLVNSIFDYPIDREILHRLEIPDQTARIRAEKTKKYLADSIKDSDDNLRRTLELIFELPMYIHDHRFGGLTSHDQEVIRRCYARYLGDNAWNSTSGLLEELAVCDVAKFCKIMPELLRKLLSLAANWKSEAKESFCKKIPSFWDKEEYELLYVD